MDNKTISDIKQCINNLNELCLYQEKTLSDDIGEEEKRFLWKQKYRDTRGVLLRVMLDIEGIESIWTDDMTNYEKVVKAIEYGFSFTTKWQSGEKTGIMIDYLGYHLWDFSESEVKELKMVEKEARATS